VEVIMGELDMHMRKDFGRDLDRVVEMSREVATYDQEKRKDLER
jgi:hypothetical protein